MPTKNSSEPNLNPDQQAAVEHTTGPLLIIAGAGTGKTTVVTERVKWLIGTKLASSDEILALTFTEKAAKEMADRIDSVLPYGTFGLWVSTFHSFCDRILRAEALQIGLSPSFRLMTEVETYQLIKDNFWKFSLEYFRPTGNPYKFIQGLVAHFSRLKDEDISCAEYLDFAEKLSASAKTDEEVEEAEKTTELARCCQEYELLKAEEGVMDFSDLISNALVLFRTRKSVLTRYQKQFKYLLVDEFQDTNLAQYHLVKLLAPLEDNSNLTVVGDDSQCLPGNVLITTDSGEKRIDRIKRGDIVLSACGKGHTTFSPVLQVGRRTEKVRLLSFTLENGKKLTVTDNHKLFAYLPGTPKSKHRTFLYLMSHRNFGWRLGITNNLTARLRIERHADGVIPIGSYDSETEARYYECYYACKYGLPTIPFTPRPGQAIAGKWLDKLFKEVDTRLAAQRLATDLNLELDSFLFVLNGVTRGQTDRLIIHLQMCYRNYRSKTHENGFVGHPEVSHIVWLETSSATTLKKLKDAGYKLTKAQKGFRYRVHTPSLSHAWQEAEKIKDITGGIIDKKFALGTLSSQHRLARIVPASHIHAGTFLPVIDGKKIIYVEVVKRDEEEKKITTYDLEVDRTHNFIANGVIVHNSIYKFRGAAISNILSFMNDYKKAKQVVLTTNYRSTKTILDGAYSLIKNNDPYTLEVQLGISKNLVPSKKQKENPVRFIHSRRVEDEAEAVVSEIKALQKKDGLEFRDFAILLRANGHSEPFVKALERAGLPFQFLGPGVLFQKECIKDLIAYLKILYDFTDSLSLYRVLSMDIWDLSQRDLLACLSEAKKTNRSLFEILEKVTDLETVSDAAKTTISSFVTLVHSHQELLPKESAGQILFRFLEGSGLFKKLVDYDSVAGEEAAKNIMKFFDRLKAFESSHKDASVRAVVDYIDLATNLGESPLAAQIDWSENNSVNLLTVHSAKGLEFPVVFLVNLVEGRFPSRDRSETIPLPTDLVKEILPEGDYHLQEERRLFYVAMTRAKSHLILTASNYYGDGKRERKVSPFVAEALGVDFVPEKTGLSVSEKQLPLIEWQSPNNLNRSGEVPAYKVDFLSYSSIDTFKLCPLHYKIRNILKIPAPMSSAQSMGNSVHLALKEYCQMQIDGELKGLSPSKKESVILDLLKRVWSHEGFATKVHEDESWAKAEKYLKAYLKSELAIDGHPIALEKAFSFYPNKTLKVIGKIDRVDDLGNGQIEIIDYKTGSLPKKSELSKDLQMDIYALAAVDPGILNRKIENVLLTFFYFESNSKLTTTRSTSDLEAARKQILDVRDQIEASDFACSHNQFCQTCEYKILCNG